MFGCVSGCDIINQLVGLFIKCLENSHYLKGFTNEMIHRYSHTDKLLLQVNWLFDT